MSDVAREYIECFAQEGKRRYEENKGRLPKKNYKLGLLAQPKVGRCPEGV